MTTHPVAAVDAYIAHAQPFAQPILAHLREAVHRAAPEVQEQMKWSRPFFVYQGVILGNLAAFKQHCSFGLWGTEMAQTLRADGFDATEGMGSFGRITSLADLPPTPQLEAYIRGAAQRIAEGTRTKSIQRVAKPTPRAEAELPAALVQALETNPSAAQQFARLSPSCRREYAAWIADAKREETRTKRLATALEWITKGKPRSAQQDRHA